MAEDQTDAQGAAEEPKLHIDADWKEQAQADKERLAREAQETAAAGAGRTAAQDQGTSAAGEPSSGQTVPPATFEGLVQSLATQALVFLSPERDPETGQSYQNLDLAKHSVDLLGMLEEKTRGNLTEDEKSLLDTVLYQVRMAYVRVAG